MNKIHFKHLNIESGLKQRNNLKNYLLTLFKKENRRVEEVNIIFCNDRYVYSLNKKFLNHNYYTDTLSFLYSVDTRPIIGDIYISVPRVKINSANFETNYQTELKRVIIHGCLHLCGYLDKPKSKFIKMTKKQESYLNNWFVSRETQIGG